MYRIALSLFFAANDTNSPVDGLQNYGGEARATARPGRTILARPGRPRGSPVQYYGGGAMLVYCTGDPRGRPGPRCCIQASRIQAGRAV